MRSRSLIVGVLVHPVAVLSQPSSDASHTTACPDLHGVYSEEGSTYRDGERASDVSHLSWLIGNGKERLALKPLNTPPGPGKPAEYFVTTIRVSHPEQGTFQLEALDAGGNRIGLFPFGPDDGWRCEDGAFVVRRQDQGGGEGTWGDRVIVHKLFREDASLVRSIHETYQQRTVFLLGAPVGASQSIDVEYHFPALAK